MADQEPLDLTAYRADIDRAHTEVGDIARAGYRRWRMSIPAQPDRDSDLLISTGLRRGERLADEVEQLQTERGQLLSRCVVLEGMARDAVEFQCPACERWALWTDGRSISAGDETDEFWCGTCGDETPLSGCARRSVVERLRTELAKVRAERDALNACIRATCSAARIAREVGDHRQVVLLSDVERLLTVPDTDGIRILRARVGGKLPPLLPPDDGQ